MISQNFLLKKVSEKLNLPENEAKKEMERIQNSIPEIVVLFENWFEKTSQIEIGGFSYSELTEIMKKTPIESLTFLNWLASNPQNEKLSERLIDEGYPKKMIEKTLDKIEKFAPQIKNLFYEWIEKGIDPEISIEGYSFNVLKTKYEMHPIGVFITLDWLIRKPEEAKSALERGVK